MYKSYIRVNTIDEAISKLNKHQNSSKIIAGGTDIMIQLRNNYKKIDLLVDVSQVSALKSIKRDRNKIIIGSAVTFSEIIESNILQQEIPILIEACRKIGAPQIRNMGTIGGNICTASGAADMVPCLFALNA
ncbi:MAG: hypothetical protein GX660_10830, partial [Clostridiaceae bacterium]|nr:hypothetical protein [Clostridiaceae bacterium]